MIYGTIGNGPYNDVRWAKLRKLHAAGYRGHVSVTAYYASDVYDLTEDGIQYLDRYGYGRHGFEYPNFDRLYQEYVVKPAKAAKREEAGRT